ncbi:zinc finger protein 729 [Culex quinquefasciatus]|uniref:zinc finger protein 729 n=1 Tax=Culex quinquefasciatus TaxID=7176 RepID=UPI0018E3CFD2|nr:zinc finger protein 729 [Culex quinquefasciatus]
MRNIKFKFQQKCRTCSRTDKFKGISVNAFSESQQEPIYLMLVYCTQLQFSPNDVLPQRICQDCLALLDAAYAFWKQSRQRDAYLRDLVLGLIPASVETNRPVPQIPTISPEPVVPVVTAAPPVSKIVPTAAETTLATPQSFWCCFRKCPKVTTNLADMEQHAKRDHFAGRLANEIQRGGAREHVCSVCCAGYDSLGTWEYHRMIQLGTRPKFGVSASATNEKPQDEENEEEQPPKDDFEATETTVVKEEAVLEESAMDFEVSDAADELSTNSTMQFEVIPVKDEPYLSDEEDASLQDALEGGNERFDCPHCGVEILSDVEKQRHLVCECPVLYNKDVRYTCELCKVTSFQKVDDLKKHMQTDCPAQEGGSKVQVVPKQCLNCQKSFYTSEGLERHAVLCTKEKDNVVKLTCLNCGGVFNSRYYFARHIKLRACFRDPNQCKHCSAKFTDQKGLKRHRKVGCSALLNAESNGLKTTCKCEHCGKGFPKKVLVRAHQVVDGCGAEDRASKPAAGKVKCPYCFIQLSRACNLKRHLANFCLVILKKQDQAEAERAAAQDGPLATTSTGT